MDMWTFVVKAFQELKNYEINEFGPQTAYLSPHEAHKMSVKEFRDWCENFRSEFLAERMHKCDKLSLALEDLKGTIKQEEIAVIVDGMMRLCDEVREMIRREIDAVSDCLIEIRNHSESFDPIMRAGEVEEEVRKLMMNFKTGFDHMAELGFPPPE
jgi:predicted CopG family antitoxin